MFSVVLGVCLSLQPAPAAGCCQPPPCGQVEELNCDQLRELERWLFKEIARLAKEAKSVQREILALMKLIQESGGSQELLDQLNALRIRLGVLRQQIAEYLELLELVQTLLSLNCQEDGR